MVSMQSAENALKSVYLGTITELLNTKANPLLTKIEQTSTDVWGKEIRRGVSYGINGGIGAGDETGDLPTPQGKNYLQFVSELKNLYGQIEISDKAIRASAEGKGAFTDLLNMELQSLLNASKFNLGRMLYGDGTGYLGTIKAKASGEYPVEKPNLLVEGMVIDVYNTADALIASGLKIKSVNRSTSKITFFNEPSTAISATSYIFMNGSKDKEITGLGAVFENNMLYGISRTEYPVLKATTRNLSAAIDDIVIQKTIDDLDYNAGSEVDYIACSLDVKYAYQDYLSQYKRNIDVMELEGGFRTLSFNGIPIVGERFIDDGQMLLLNTKLFKMHQLCDWRFLETESGKILRQNQGKATYTATLVKYCDLICEKPNGIARIINIATA